MAHSHNLDSTASQPLMGASVWTRGTSWAQRMYTQATCSNHCKRALLICCLVIITLSALVFWFWRNSSSEYSLVSAIRSPEIPHGPLSPSTLVYLWCKNSAHFEFKHYLSLQSAVRYFHPTEIIFYHNTLPKLDLYYAWFEDLKAELGDKLHLIQISHSVCSTPSTQRDFVVTAVSAAGGLYLSHSAVLTPLARQLTPQQAASYNMLDTDTQGLLYVPRSTTNSSGNSALNSVANKDGTVVQKCSTITHPVEDIKVVTDAYCLVIQEETNLYPKDIMFLDTKFAWIAREVAYGVPDIVQPVKSNSTLIPKITHMWWIGDNPISFLFYLSVLSQLFIVEADNVFVYGDKEPTGEYWSKLRDYDKVQYVYYPRITNVHGVGVRSPSLMSDVFRSEIIYEKGGIYIDVDAVFVRSIEDLRQYDAIGTLDITHDKGNFPEYFNLGVTMGKKGSPFWKNMKEGMKNFQTDIYGYNGICMPYKIWEKYPTLLYRNPHLQVICWEGHCSPTWIPNFLDVSVRNKTKHWNWRQDTCAVHFTHPTPKALTGEDALRSSNTFYADIGKYIYQKAGLTL